MARYKNSLKTGNMMIRKEENMKNKEYYVEKIIGLVAERKPIAVKNGKPITCYEINCCECDINKGNCSKKLKEWLEAEHKEKVVDWEKVPVDTKILVRDEESKESYKRHFSRYDNGNVYSFVDGCSSYTTEHDTKWDYAELAEPNEDYMKEV